MTFSITEIPTAIPHHGSKAQEFRHSVGQWANGTSQIFIRCSPPVSHGDQVVIGQAASFTRPVPFATESQSVFCLQ
jgi:hypothetical protein